MVSGKRSKEMKIPKTIIGWGKTKTIEVDSPTKTELMEKNWYEFLEWVADSRVHVGTHVPYDYYNEPKDGTAHYVPLVSEHNFWLWFLDTKVDENGKIYPEEEIGDVT
jgi:hypothetical protein